MKVEVINYIDYWQEIKSAALFTMHKESKNYPSSEWKRKILLAEHSPIRLGKLTIALYDVPSFVIGHLVRHNIGFTPFVSSLREDRYNSKEVPNRNTLNNVMFECNFQAFINISRKRCCNCASKETREVWNTVLKEVEKYETELVSVCVRECIYRGHCTEMFSCGYDKTEAFKEELNKYNTN